MQQPHSPSIGNGAGVGCSELPPMCCSPSRKWARARDSAPEAGGHTSRAPRAGHGAQPGSATRPGNAEGATGGSAQGPGSASHGMAS